MATNRICSIPDCGKPVDKKGWCSSHYTRWHHHGDPLAGGPAKTPAGTLVAYIFDTALPYDGEDCLPWPFTTNGKGYGQVRFAGRRHIASRLLCELANGSPPTSVAETAHSCGNGHLGCVNPGHLRWDTRSGNQQDRVEHNTHTRGERNYNAKVTVDRVRTIRALAGKQTLRTTADQFGITPTMVRFIQTRKNWAWLE